MGILDDIKKNTEFEVLGSGKVKVFTNRNGVTTPLKALDTLIGGFIPFGSVVDLFGPPASGKSSYGYECMGHFQKEYPEGLSILIDTEASVDTKRMKALGVDPDRVLVLKGATLEKGYRQIISILKSLTELKPKERVPVFVLWDSLSSSTTEAQLNKENVNGGGIAEAPRINKEFLKQINIYLEKVDAIVMLINQVSAKIGMFVGNGYNEAGGNALKHEIHYKLEFSPPKTGYEFGIACNSYASVKITKNKIGPTTEAFPFSINILEGGVIDKAWSMVAWMSDYIFEKIRGNTHIILEKMFIDYPFFHEYLSNRYPKFLKKFLWDAFTDAVRDEINTMEVSPLMNILVLKWIDVISNRYKLQADVLSPLRANIVNELSKYFNENELNFNATYESASISNESDDEESSSGDE